MNLKNRAFRLFAIVSIMSSLLASPASASEITFDTSGLKVPAGITFAVEGIKFENGHSNLLVTINSTLEPTSKVLTFKDFKISGILNGSNPVAAKIQYFYGDSLTWQTAIYLLEGDITAQKLNLVISGNGTLENRSDIAYPKSYSRVIASLDAMGLEVIEGNNTQSSDNSFQYYVLAKLKTGVAPFQIKVNSATLSANGVVVETLNNNFALPISMGVEPVEISLGSGLVDPIIRLTEVTLDAKFGRYTPSTLASSFSLPAGITSAAVTGNNIYYDRVSKKSSINILFKNTSKKTISVNFAQIKVVDKSTGTAKVVGTVDKNYSLGSIQPSTSPDDGYGINLTGDGDLTEKLILNIEGNVEIASPSKLDVSGVTLPKGFKLLPINFNNLAYDPKKNTTLLYLSITKSGASANLPALSFTNMKLASGNISTKYLYAGPYTDSDKGIQYYSHEIGSYKGDVRTGKKLQLSGNIVTVDRTKYTNTATLPENDEELVSNSYLTPAELWTYNSKTKTTSITQLFYSSKQSSDATIYSCNLQIIVNGKTIKGTDTGVKYDSTASNGEVIIATLPGDLRIKGGSVQITGSYSLRPCK